MCPKRATVLIFLSINSTFDILLCESSTIPSCTVPLPSSKVKVVIYLLFYSEPACYMVKSAVMVYTVIGPLQPTLIADLLY